MKKIIYLTFLVFSINTFAQNTTVNYQYDNLYRLTKATYPNGSYIQYTYDANGNRTQTVNSTLAVEESTQKNMQTNVFPNPFSDELNIQSKNQIKEIVLYDFSGKLIKEEKPNSAFQYTFHAENLPSGVYMLVVTSENGRESFKVIKK